MKGGNEEGKAISPMFPRLHIKDAEKGGPKAPPRNKMALYEQFSKPSQSFFSGYNCQVPSTPGHVGSRQSIQFCTSTAPSYLDEKIYSYHSGKVNFNKLQPDNLFNCKYSPQKIDGKDGFITPDSARGRNSCSSIAQNNENEQKLAHLQSCNSLNSQNSLRKMVHSTGSTELKSAQYGKNQKEELSEVSQTNQKSEGGSSHPLAGFGDMADASSIEVKIPKPLQGGNAHTHKEHAALKDKISLRDSFLEKMAVSDVHKHPDGLEIGSNCYQVKRGSHKDDDMYRHYDVSNKPISDSTFGMDFSPDDVLGVIGEKQFWKARGTIINQQRIFFVQLFELHRLVEVQRSFAGSPHLFLEDSLQVSKPTVKVSAPKKLPSEAVTERSSSNVKLDGKSEKPTTSEPPENNAVMKVHVPCISNSMNKGIVNQMSNNGHQIVHAAMNDKQSAYCIYPPPGNQWLVPVMSPSEGLVYKPVMGSCPPSVGFMAPVYGACGPMSLSSGTKDISDSAHGILASHHGIGIPSGTALAQLFPPLVPPLLHPSISGDADSAILSQSSSNIPSQMSKLMPTEFQDFHSSKVLQRSTASSPNKRKKRDVLPLFPVAPTSWKAAPADQNTLAIDQQPRVIKALPHNPRLATESAARIFRSIQEERKHL